MIDSLWDWFEYEMMMTSGSVFVSSRAYNEPGDALDCAIDRALSMDYTVEVITIMSCDYDEYVM